jgi:hypothetical protein
MTDDTALRAISVDLRADFNLAVTEFDTRLG